MYFAVITDKLRKKYIVVKTSFIEALEGVFIQQDKEIYSMQAFSDRYNDRLERIEYIKFLRKRGYRFKYRLLFDFLK
ncbi:unknown [Fusobacterium sp. CAG:439]|nr:unknown [Fusobacterium sp. CAG:439]